MSDLFTVEKKIADAAFPRASGSTILSTDRLKIVYNKYLTTQGAISKDKIKINLVFAHGTGMNKMIWNYHITKLFELAQSSSTYVLNSVLAIDAVQHGDSALINEGKIGWVFMWDEGGKDIVEVVKHEQQTTNEFVNNADTKNILIGHSLGGFMSVMAAFYEPSMFDAVIPIEGVLYTDDNSSIRFMKVFSKLGQLLIDKFDSEEEYNDYFTKFSIYKNFDKRVLKDFMEDERGTWVDPETKETKFITKASTPNQMTTYYSAGLSVPFGMGLYPYIIVPVLHVIGEKGSWNPKESIGWFRNTIAKEYLLDGVNVPEGEHLLNAERPDELIKILQDTILKRVDAATKTRPNIPEVKYNNNRKLILETQWNTTMEVLAKKAEETARKVKAAKSSKL